MTLKTFILAALACLTATAASAQEQQSSTSSAVMTRGPRTRPGQTDSSTPGVSARMQQQLGASADASRPDASLKYVRVIYRELDLEKEDANAPLYFPEDYVDGNENLFRIMFRLLAQNKIPAYEYLDGREAFTDQYKVKVADMLDRFGIYYTQGKGSTEKNPKFVIEEADVPTGQVLNYYIVEKWEFDRRSNRMKTRVEAICPVLNRSGDFGGEARYPMFWVRFDQLRPWLSQQYVFLSDDNNLARYSLDDYFNLGMYEGDIYKTRNLRNLSMAQMYPDADDLKRAQDSIDNRLKSYGKNQWMPTREEYLAMKEKQEEDAAKLAAGDSIPDRTVASDEEQTTSVRKASRRSSRSAAKRRSKPKSKVKKAPKPKSSDGNSNASKSVRRRRR